jgi:HTH-type transcriptional regulator/antitoxin HipB
MSPFGYSIGAALEIPDMKIRTATDLGAFIRERRIKLEMDQSDLAEKAGISRKWIVEVEQGKPRAEIGLVLRTLTTLGVSLDIAVDRTQKALTSSQSKNVDINHVLNSLKKRP